MGQRGGRARGLKTRAAGSVRHLRAAVSHVEVDDILGISPLHGDGKRLERVEGEGNEASHRVVDGAAQ